MQGLAGPSDERLLHSAVEPPPLPPPSARCSRWDTGRAAGGQAQGVGLSMTLSSATPTSYIAPPPPPSHPGQARGAGLTTAASPPADILPTDLPPPPPLPGPRRGVSQCVDSGWHGAPEAMSASLHAPPLPPGAPPLPRGAPPLQFSESAAPPLPPGLPPADLASGCAVQRASEAKGLAAAAVRAPSLAQKRHAAAGVVGAPRQGKLAGMFATGSSDDEC